MNTESTSSQKTHYKRNALIIFIVIILGLGVYGFFWYKGVQKRDALAKQVIEQSEMYLQLNQKIESEVDRCNSFIAGETGDFGQFEYCKKFKEWALSTTEEN